MRRRRDAEAELNLPPGFRFHPTDEELLLHYLSPKLTYHFLPLPIIAEVDLYKYDPWQLPEKALFGQKEWYFFTPRERKYPNGSRPNRIAGSGYWKATGADKPIRPTGSSKPVGIKKALVFYTGKAPKGFKTNWIMHEYRLADSNCSPNKKGNLRLDNWVLCRLYNKKNNYVKIPLQREEETIDEAIEETGLDSMGTPELDVNSSSLTSVDDLEIPKQIPSQPVDGVKMNSFQIGELPKEEMERFMMLNEEDLKDSLALLDAMPISDLMTQDYYFSGLCSPQFKSSQSSFFPF